MTLPARMDDDLREKIISKPSVILDDIDVMRALIAANDERIGGNVIDLRGIAMERLESRLDQLEDTHRSVIAAAYENLAGTNQVHRAVLALLEATRFEGFLEGLGGPVADILTVDAVRLVLEDPQEDTPEDTRAGKLSGALPASDVLARAEPGFVEAYVTESGVGAPRVVTLRQIAEGPREIYGARGARLGSEACLLLDLGPRRGPGLLLLGSEDAGMFTPQHGADLLTFFAGAFERALRRWLA